MSRKFQVNKNLIGMTGMLYEEKYTLMITSRSVPLRMGNVLDEFVDRINHTFYVQ
jgi:hypothetical protein